MSDVAKNHVYDLRSTYLFSVLDDSQLERVATMGMPVQLRDGEQLFTTGDKAKVFYLVLEGQIKLFRLASSGDEKVIEIVRAGNTFAEALMFQSQQTFPVSAQAIGDVRLLAFSHSSFLLLLRESVDTCFRLMGDMSARLRHMIMEINDLTLQNATGRVAGYLCSQVHGKSGNGCCDGFDLAAPKGVLASRLSVKPETFSRILHNLMDKDIISVKGGHIDVLNVDELRSIAQATDICPRSIGPPPA